MVKHGHKKEEIKKSSLLYNIKNSEEKTERNLNEGTSGLKASFKKEKKKEKTKCIPPQTLKNIRVSAREALFRYVITET